MLLPLIFAIVAVLGISAFAWLLWSYDRGRRFALAFLAVALVGGVAGCAVSKPFALGVPPAVTLISNDAAHYAISDAQKAQVKALTDAAADKAVTAASLKAAWEPVRDFFLTAVDADPQLSTDERKLKHDTAAKLDKTIADELARPLVGH